jgi:hypothetical protein
VRGLFRRIRDQTKRSHKRENKVWSLGRIGTVPRLKAVRQEPPRGAAFRRRWVECLEPGLPPGLD